MELSEKRKSRALSAELAVIGALCLEPERWGGEVFHKLRAEDFGDATYRNLYKAARQIWLDQKPLDAVTLQGAVGKDYTAAIVDAMQLTPTTANTAAYADIVAQEARLRALQEIGSKLTFLEDLDAAQGLLSKAENLLTTQDGLFCRLNRGYLISTQIQPIRVLQYGIGQVFEFFLPCFYIAI